MGISNEFVQPPYKKVSFKIGKKFATPLSGFIAGFVSAAIVLIPLSILMCRYAQGVPLK